MITTASVAQLHWKPGLADKLLSISRRTRKTPFTPRVEAAGVKAYTVYNHMLLPAFFESNEADYWSLSSQGSEILSYLDLYDKIILDETGSISSTEQTAYANFIAAGTAGDKKGFFLLGRDVSYYSSTRPFIQQYMRADYVQDDSGVYSVSGVAGSAFAGLGPITFDDGSGPTYAVNWPDVIDPVNGTTAPVVLTSGEYNPDVDAGLFRKGSIHVFGFLDDDGDGNLDPEDGPFPSDPGKTIELLDADDQVIETMVTDEDGAVWFVGLVPGEYTVLVCAYDRVDAPFDPSAAFATARAKLTVTPLIG